MIPHTWLTLKQSRRPFKFWKAANHNKKVEVPVYLCVDMLDECRSASLVTAGLNAEWIKGICYYDDPKKKKKLVCCLSGWIPIPMIITSPLVILIIFPSWHYLNTIWQFGSIPAALCTHSCPLQLPSAVHSLGKPRSRLKSRGLPLKLVPHNLYFMLETDTWKQHLNIFNTFVQTTCQYVTFSSIQKQ